VTLSRSAAATLVITLLLTMSQAPFALGSERVSAQEDHTDHETPTPTPVPIDGQPPGERNPYIALIAALAIVVVGVTGIFIYRMIKEGL
jgi:hypothetical protein